MDRFGFLQADRERATLIDHIGACERIRRSPLPTVYAINIRRFIFLYLGTLPFALIERVSGPMVPLITLIVSFAILELDQIGVELQGPFDVKNLGHLPLGSLCEMIQGNLLALLHAAPGGPGGAAPENRGDGHSTCSVRPPDPAVVLRRGAPPHWASRAGRTSGGPRTARRSGREEGDGRGSALESRRDRGARHRIHRRPARHTSGPGRAHEAGPGPQGAEPAPAEEGPEETAPAPETADISFTATVRAREMRHEVTPRVEVEFPGHPKRRTGTETHRKNFPRGVQPGVTYRDIEVRVTISSVFDDIDRIVQEATTPKAQPKGPAPPAVQPKAGEPREAPPATDRPDRRGP
jgi:hypothetical protein